MARVIVEALGADAVELHESPGKGLHLRAVEHVGHLHVAAGVVELLAVGVAVFGAEGGQDKGAQATAQPPREGG
jgi:hypothetical protein